MNGSDASQGPSAEEVVRRIQEHQEGKGPFSAHPLTCGNDSTHPDLEAVIENGKVVLICTQQGCEYRQAHIPEDFLK